MKTSIALLLLLAGCGPVTVPVISPHEDVTPEYNIPEDGLRFRPSSADVLSPQEFTTLYNRAYLETEACVGVLAVGPLVVAVPNDSLGKDSKGLPIRAFTYFEANLTRIELDWQRYEPIIRHEFVHHLLDAAGFDRQDNACHRSPLFLICTGLDVASNC